MRGQVDDLIEESRVRVERGDRVLVTTLTKRMAEDLSEYMRELGYQGALYAFGCRFARARGNYQGFAFG